MSIIISAAVVGITGMAVGLLLGVAGEKLKVETDERETKIRELLPGNNCGGCGYPGCDGLAAAIVKGQAKVNACPVGGDEIGKAIGDIMGMEAEGGAKQVAYVKCKGTCDKVEEKYNYYGEKDCKKAVLLPGKTKKACVYGCMGYGSCVKACPFDAIHIEEGVAKVDKEKCKACGKCIAACPQGIIELVPYENVCVIACFSKDKGKDVRNICKAGCIGCMLCKKVCESGAITIENNLAVIDYEKCIGCGKCEEKCPAKIIKRA